MKITKKEKCYKIKTVISLGWVLCVPSAFAAIVFTEGKFLDYEVLLADFVDDSQYFWAKIVLIFINICLNLFICLALPTLFILVERVKDN